MERGDKKIYQCKYVSQSLVLSPSSKCLPGQRFPWQLRSYSLFFTSNVPIYGLQMLAGMWSGDFFHFRPEGPWPLHHSEFPGLVHDDTPTLTLTVQTWGLILTTVQYSTVFVHCILCTHSWGDGQTPRIPLNVSTILWWISCIYHPLEMCVRVALRNYIQGGLAGSWSAHIHPNYTKASKGTVKDSCIHLNVPTSPARGFLYPRIPANMLHYPAFYVIVFANLIGISAISLLF